MTTVTAATARHFGVSPYFSIHKASWLVLLAGALFVAVWIAPPTHAFQKLDAYLPLHTLVETFAVVVAALIFGIGWNAGNAERASNIVLLSCVFLAVGLLDFAHFMSYAGMPDFVTPSGPSKAIDFWLAARFVAAAGLLAVAVLPWRPFANPALRYVLLAASLAVTGLVYWATLFHQAALPETFVPGQGLTPFKVSAEYAVIFIHLATIALLVTKLRQSQPFDAPGLLAAVSLMALGELCFTLYLEVTDAFNLLGHGYKVLAYALLYRTVFVNSVREPFEKLFESRDAAWREKERAQVTLESIGDAVITAEADGRIEYLNPVAEEMTGWRKEEARGQPLVRVFNIVNEHSRAKVENPLEICLREGRVIGLANHTVLIRRDGHEFAIEDSAAPIRSRDGSISGAVMVFHDVSERRSFERQIHHLAHHDPLTGLPNRTLLQDRLNQALGHARRHKSMVGVLFLDLDRFKTINDTLGHDFGDELLRDVAERLAECIRETDSAGRLGGDEFMVILSDITKAQDCAHACENILQEFSRPFVVLGNEFYVTCSIGVSLYPSDGEDEQTLIRNADIAMYRAKDLGRNTYQFYTADMNARAFERLALENSLRHALERDELRVYYQPRVNAATGRITGTEALVRWQHPDMGLVPPAKFIPLAEESGLIVPIGEFVMRTACAQNKAWQAAGLPPITMAVNLSARQFREADLILAVGSILKETGLDPHCLELELTESMLMQQVEAPVLVLRALKEMGIKIAIDDFGTGFSSLSYLKRFPIDYLKIDRSFVQDVTEDANDAAIVQAIIAMAHSLGLELVAEGVEKREQIDFLRRHDCEEMQGFYFSRPVPAEEFTELLKAGGSFPVPSK